MIGIFADIARSRSHVQIFGKIELYDFVVDLQPFVGVVHIRQGLAVGRFLLLLRLGNGVAGSRDFALVAIKDGERNAS